LELQNHGHHQIAYATANPDPHIAAAEETVALDMAAQCSRYILGFVVGVTLESLAS
jgi:hypothetical protein